MADANGAFTTGTDTPDADIPTFDTASHAEPLAEALAGLTLSVDVKVPGEAARLAVVRMLLDSPAMATLLAEHRNAVIDDVLGHARHVITQYLSTAEKWRYDRVCWAFAIILGEIPADTPAPLSPADEAEIARHHAAATSEGARPMNATPDTEATEVRNDHSERFVVVGTNTDGTTIVLEAVTDPDQWTERLAHWRKPANSAPYNHDVHMSREVVTIEYRRMDDAAHQRL